MCPSWLRLCVLATNFIPNGEKNIVIWRVTNQLFRNFNREVGKVHLWKKKSILATGTALFQLFAHSVKGKTWFYLAIISFSDINNMPKIFRFHYVERLSCSNTTDLKCYAKCYKFFILNSYFLLVFQ